MWHTAARGASGKDITRGPPDAIRIDASEAIRTFAHRDRAFGAVPHSQAGNAQGGSFLLHSTGRIAIPMCHLF